MLLWCLETIDLQQMENKTEGNEFRIGFIELILLGNKLLNAILQSQIIFASRYHCVGFIDHDSIKIWNVLSLFRNCFFS